MTVSGYTLFDMGQIPIRNLCVANDSQRRLRFRATMIKRASLFRALLVFLTLIAVSASAEEQIQAPVFKEGDFWKFKIIQKAAPGYPRAEWNGDYMMRYANGRIQVRKLIDEKEVPPEPNGIPALLGFRKTEQERAVEFPLYVGKQYRYSFKFLKATDVFNIEVMAEEQVTTEAGTFQAFKIKSTKQWAEPGGGMITVPATYFYSPKAKTIVKYDSESDHGYILHIELLKFESSR